MIRSDPVTLVSGLPRSGTSLMMSMLAAGGLSLLVDEARPADADNPRGYFEYQPVRTTAADASWLAAAEGRAVKVVYKILFDLPIDRRYRVVFMHRRLEEVLASQDLMLRRRGADVEPMDLDRFGALFGAEIDRTLAWLDRQPAFDRLDVDYNRLVADPDPVVAAIDTFLGGGLDRPAMRAVVDPSLYRQRG